MTSFIIAYILLSLAVFFVINRLFLRRKKVKPVDTKEQVVEETPVYDHQAEKVTYEQPIKTHVEPAQPEVIYNSSTRSTHEKIEPEYSEEVIYDSEAARTHEEVETATASTEESPREAAAHAHGPNLTFGKNITIPKIITALMIGMFIAILNQTLINVALPVLINDFGITTSTAQWLTTGFMLVNGILVPISAFLIQRFTYRQLFMTAMMFFTVGSLICAIAGNFPMMMVGRLTQAVGAGILMPLGTNIFMSIFPPDKRGAAMGMMGIAFILAPAIGPTLTGWVIQNYHWNVMFYGMFIIGAIALLIGSVWFKIAQPTHNAKLDIPGVIFSTIGFGSILYGFSEAGNKGWDSPVVDSTIIIGLIFVGLFVYRELSMKNPMMDLSTLKYSGFSFTTLINIIVTMALFGGMILLPIYLQSIRGFSPLDSGLLLLPGSLLMGLMGPIAGRLFDKVGIKPLAIFGLAIMTYATWELTKLNMDTPYSHILGIYILRSFGMAFIMMPIMTAGMNSLPGRLIPHGNAFSNTIRQLAGSIGTAILVTVMTQQTSAHIGDIANSLDKTNPAVMNQIQQAGQAVGSDALGTQMMLGRMQQLATINGINDAFWVATVLSALAFILSFFLKGKDHYRSDEA
ncbi:DHA2 family efflux MFS transporter permease subunit [Macrococcus brunensis]|uniref:Quinolone resistance protein NorB n=1 Tax=Macrococcus brunensis TaxID=198483 RepID=A0A4V3BDM5_9STAP|nr:DHA2 family efflux MFS transporter permease subunit [Macrococcus brunensis]TDL99016.1 DHA2 family efflux MFS transporter permease subunit [Macrococcus brunensis]ULG72452.1 DHA2 family efflux MFS transporter permease subunit [Macrococcus brunensis]ULG74707.1 DHA2 family efflux MFS transporter permease subunit [Macrococcus brunensis]